MRLTGSSDRRGRARKEDSINRRLLVTGGTGFLGGHLARTLLAQGHDVRLMGRDFRAAGELLAAGAIPLNADLRDPAAVIAACAGMDAVYHAGALSAPWGRTAEFEAINVGGTAAVVAGCRRHGVRRLVYVSSPSVVFDGYDHRDLAEDAPYPARFTSVYARTKKRGEDLVNAASGNLETVILRPKALFGPGDRSLLPRLIAAAQAGRLPQIGDGRNLVDLTYVENAADALLLALDAPGAVGRTYFITNGEHIPLWQVIREALATLGLPTQLRHISVQVALGVARLLEAYATLSGREPLLTTYSVQILARTQTYDTGAATRDLGYTPRISFAEGMRRTLLALKTSGTEVAQRSAP
ncbi:MAG TPA: NAD-dependent epimerase/dehydratase family protein [Ktedonobacterales bacterium]